MNLLTRGCSCGNLSSVLCVPKIITFSILGLFFVLASVSDGSPGPGYITGDVTVFQKKLFGKLKKKKDMSGVFVYITGFKSEAPDAIPDIVQEDRKFYPDILPVVVGQKVRFPNHDHIYHNVFSISPTKVFDLGQYKECDSPKCVTFEKPGLVPVFCNIHPQMLTYVIVLENNAYAMTDKEGDFQIGNVPSGTYTVNAWLPKAKHVSQKILIQPGQDVEAHLEIKEIIKMKPHTRKDGSDYPPEEEMTIYAD
jgi:plastocyanin